MSIELLPITPCTATPAESCAPQSCDLPGIYRSLQAVCARLYELEVKVEALNQSIPAFDTVAMLIRKGVDMENRMKRMEQSAIICITWNEATCAIQGTTSKGTVKVFDPDPCSVSLQRRVAILESVSNALGAMAALTQDVTELNDQIQFAIKSVTMGSNCELAIETIGGTVTPLNIHGCAPATVVIAQEVITVPVVVPVAMAYDKPFTVPHDSVVEIYAIFPAPTVGEIYDFEMFHVIDGDWISINTWKGEGAGAFMEHRVDGIYHGSRTAQITVDKGEYVLRIAEHAGFQVEGLQVSLQMKAII